MCKEARCVLTLVVAMFIEIRDEGIIGNAPSLGKTIHAFVDLHINISIDSNCMQVVLLDDVIGNDVNGDVHVFISVHGIVEEEIFNVNAHEAGIWCGDDTVEEDFDSGEVCNLCGDIERIVNFVATYCVSDMSHFLFLWSVITDNAKVGSSAAGRHLGGMDEKDGVSSCGHGRLSALCKASKFIAAAVFPVVAITAVEEFFVVSWEIGVWIDGFQGTVSVGGVIDTEVGGDPLDSSIVSLVAGMETHGAGAPLVRSWWRP